jgi:hypothetical protein
MDKVCILWRYSPTARTINCLTHGHGGEIRVYARDAIDPRVGAVCHVSTMEEALDVLRRGDETKVAVPVSVARRLRDSSWVFEEHP